jgi:asparagine synthase (glutamine-hydrolysing)
VRPEGLTAVQLSGGVDSAAVLALACEQAPAERLRVFTVDFPDSRHPAFSEASLAREQCAFLGLEPASHTVLSLSSGELLQRLPMAVRDSEGPMVNAHGVAKHGLSQAIRQAGIKVVLSGEGADELLFGYRHFLAHLAGGAPADPLEDPAGLGILTSRERTHGLAGVAARLGFVPEIWVSKWQLGQRIQAFLQAEFLAGFAGRDPFLESLEEAEPPRGVSAPEVVRWLWLGSALRSYILEVLGDGCEMAHSVEGRPPFLDHVLWERVAAFPLSALAPDKRLLRQAMAGRVVPSILQRAKHPFMAPPLGPPLIGALRKAMQEQEHPLIDRRQGLGLLTRLDALRGPEAWEWEPALFWLLSSFHLMEHRRVG